MYSYSKHSSAYDLCFNNPNTIDFLIVLIIGKIRFISNLKSCMQNCTISFWTSSLKEVRKYWKKSKGGQWTMPGIWNWAFPKNISNFIAPFLSVVNCDCGFLILSLLDLPPGVFIPAGDASSMKELHLAMIYPDFQRWLNVPTVKKLKFVFLLNVGKYFLAL